MKKILASLAIVGLLCSSAYAGGKIVKPKGSTYGESVRILQQGYTGQRTTTVTPRSEFTAEFDGGCIRILRVTWTGTQTDTYKWGDLQGTSYQWDEPTTEVLVEFCP